MRFIILLSIVLSGVKCYSQYQKIDYHDWDGRPCFLVGFAYIDDIVALTVTEIEKTDTVSLLLGPENPEILKMLVNLEGFSNSDTIYAYKYSEAGEELLCVQYCMPLQMDSTKRLRYFDFFLERKLLPK